MFSFIRGEPGESARFLDLIDRRGRQERAAARLNVCLRGSRDSDALTQPELFMSRSPRFIRRSPPRRSPLAPSLRFCSANRAGKEDASNVSIEKRSRGDRARFFCSRKIEIYLINFCRCRARLTRENINARGYICEGVSRLWRGWV